MGDSVYPNPKEILEDPVPADARLKRSVLSKVASYGNMDVARDVSDVKPEAAEKTKEAMKKAQEGKPGSHVDQYKGKDDEGKRTR